MVNGRSAAALRPCAAEREPPRGTAPKCGVTPLMASSAGRESVEVAMPSSALTRFLKQRLARGMCPLCRVTHKLDREFT
jgi:hypothetical protein